MSAPIAAVTAMATAPQNATRNVGLVTFEPPARAPMAPRAASPNKQAIETQINVLFPAQKASAEAAQAQAQVELEKMTVRAGVDGILEQFTLRKGDIVNPVLRPAGVLIPSDAGRRGLWEGFVTL